MAFNRGQRQIVRLLQSAPQYRQAGPKVRQALIEAGIVESNLTNLTGGDRDSAGVLQQRPSQGWGSYQQVRNPRYAAEQFLRRAIPLAGKYGSAGQLAQAVQRSAFPERYDEHAGEAAALLRGTHGPAIEQAAAELRGVTVPHETPQAPNGAVLGLLQGLLAPQQGGSVAQTPLTRPETAGGPRVASTGPKVPSAPIPQQAPENADLAKILAQLSEGTATPEAGAGGQASAPPASAPQGRPATGGYPLGRTGKVIGTPYSGTHTLGNWESDNAIDLAVPKGTPVYATGSGTIGSQIGSLGAASGSRFAGERLHLVTQGNEWYYAHLSRIVVKAGQRVKAGQLLGYSGEANGVAHLHIASKSGSPLSLTKRR